MKYAARIGLIGLGLLSVLVGAVWIGQGTGAFPYPASSFMINDPTWILWGAILAIIGVALVLLGRRV